MRPRRLGLHLGNRCVGLVKPLAGDCLGKRGGKSTDHYETTQRWPAGRRRKAEGAGGVGGGEGGQAGENVTIPAHLGEPSRGKTAREAGTMRAEGEAEGLQTLGIVVALCSSLKLLHYLGLIDLSDGKRTLELPYVIGTCFSASVVTRSLETARKGARRPESFGGLG